MIYMGSLSTMYIGDPSFILQAARSRLDQHQ